MKKVEILSVGTELLMGQISNTNAQYISAKLPETGLGVFYHSVVGDNGQRLKDSLGIALERADIIIMTGGLGPTMDDLTKETVAEYFGLRMVFDEKSYSNIEAYFTAKGRKMTENNRRQAYFPDGADIFYNDFGTAPGCALKVTYKECGKIIIMLPGPPRELKPMFDRSVVPYLVSACELTPLYSVFLRISGIGESAVEDSLMGLVKGQTNPTIATYAKDGNVTVRISACDAEGLSAMELAMNMAAECRKILGTAIYSETDEEPAECVVRLLSERKMTLSAAESCTGGMIAEKITSVPGSSKVFLLGAVTYATSCKEDILGVNGRTIETYSAVSAQTAREMAEGARKISGSDIAVSVTGYAGPAVGDEPVGLVYIGFSSREGSCAYENHFTGDRERVRTLATMKALDIIRRYAEGGGF